MTTKSSARCVVLGVTLTRFLDLSAIHGPLAPELAGAMQRVLESGRFILGPEVEAFEAELAEHEGAKHVVGVGNGLDALALLLRALGIGAGDEVIVPSNTFVATWLAVTLVGAVPVPVEPSPSTHNIDPAGLAEVIGPRTAAIIPVHLYGQPADMESINRIASERSLAVIADGAQSVGANLGGAPVAGHALATTLSFYPGKNLGALGDGGAILTDDAQVADRVRLLGNYGSRARYNHELAGQNSRLDEIQAALLRVKLRSLDMWTHKRRALANRYSRGLAGTTAILPAVLPGADPVWHLYVVRHRLRDRLAEFLADRGVETLIHYPVPPHRQNAYSGSSWDLPIADELASSVLSLPMGPHLSEADVDDVVGLVWEFGESQ